MGMQALQQLRGPDVSNPMSALEGMAALVKLQNESGDKFTNAVDSYGQDRARGLVSDAMGEGQFDGQDPEQTQALIAKLTGGRGMGERGSEMLKQLYGNKGDVQTNDWRKEEATLADSRANARQAQGHANSVKLAGLNNRARQKLYGDKATTDGKQGTGLLDLQHDVELLQNEYMDDFTTPERKKQIKSELNRKKIRTEMAIKKGGHNAGAGLSIMNSVNPAMVGDAPVSAGYGKDGKDMSDDAMFAHFKKKLNWRKLPKKKGKKQLYSVVLPDGSSANVSHSEMASIGRKIGK